MAFKLRNSPFKALGGPGDPERLPSVSNQRIEKDLSKGGGGSRPSTIIDPYANKYTSSSTVPIEGSNYSGFSASSTPQAPVDDSKSLSKFREKLLTTNFIRQNPNLRDRVSKSYDKKRRNSAGGGGGYTNRRGNFKPPTPWNLYREEVKDLKRDIRKEKLFSEKRRGLKKDMYGMYDETGRNYSMKNKAQLRYKSRGGKVSFNIPIASGERKFKGFSGKDLRGATNYAGRSTSAGSNQSFCTAKGGCKQVNPFIQ